MALSGEGLRHINLAEGQTTPPTSKQLHTGLAPGEDPPSSLAILAPEMPSTLSWTKRSISATFLVYGQGLAQVTAWPRGSAWF